MIALPILAALISGVFGVHLLGRSATRRTWFEAVWGVALLMFSAASAALALGVLDGWSSAEFRVYWLFGAVLNVPYLALGEAYLLIPNRAVAHALLVVVLGATAWASAEIRSAPLDEAVLASEPFFSGREVLGEEAPARTLALIYSYTGTAVLVGGILLSAIRMSGRPELRNRFYGVLLIALGAVVVAAGAAFAAAGSFGGFSGTLAAGVAVMYWGFLTASRRAPRRGRDPQETPRADRPRPTRPARS